jgi:hypothetical protein
MSRGHPTCPSVPTRSARPQPLTRWRRLERWLLCLAWPLTGWTAPAPATPDPLPAPTDVALTITVLRHRPNTVAVLPARLIEASGLTDLVRILKEAGPVEVLHHARRDLACDPTGQTRWAITELRPLVQVEGSSATPTNRTLGLQLTTDVRVMLPPTPTTPALLALSWEGSWTGSTALLARWEQLAVRGFNLAATIPGITYTKVEEDEDGFVNTGGGADIGGLFRRRKKEKNPPKAAPAKSPAKGAAPTAPKPSAGSPATGEPSYAAEVAQEDLALRGDWLGVGGQLLITRARLTQGDKPGDLYVIFQARTAD